MEQKLEAASSETSSWVPENDQYNIADEVEWACTRLQNAVRDERIARESLESLFQKRKEDALEGVKKAQQHLEFVNQEEGRLRQSVADENVSTEKAPGTFGDDKKGVPDQRKVLHDFFQSLINESHRKKAESSETKVPSTLQVYLIEEERSLGYCRVSLNKHEENVKSLLQLVESFQKPRTVTTGCLQKDSSQDQRIEIDGVQAVESNDPAEGDIAVLRERLEKEEREVQWWLRIIHGKEAKVASYRRLIAASSP